VRSALVVAVAVDLAGRARIRRVEVVTENPPAYDDGE
jgi:hypothetical protein